MATGIEETFGWFKREPAAILFRERFNMLTDYIQAAMRQAHYELMENNKFFATIPPCKGLWAEGVTLEKCREELQSTLEDWLLLGFQLGHKLPVIDGINLNRMNRRKPAHAQAR